MPPSDRRVDLNGSVTETHGSGDDLLVTTTSIDGTVSSFQPIDDPALPGLRPLLDPDLRSGLLAELLGWPMDVSSHTEARIVRYRAGRRATVRIEPRNVDPSRKLPVPHSTVFAKVFHDLGKAESTATSLSKLMPQLTAESLTRLPALVAHHHTLGIVVLHEMIGQPLELPTPLGAGNDSVVETIKSFSRVGAALAELHSLDPSHLPPRPTAVDFAKAETRVEFVTDERTRTRLHDLLTHLAETGPADPPYLVPVHGDCKPSQVLLGTTISFLDPDHLGAGDPAADVAQMHVSLFQEAVRRDGAIGGAATDTARHLIESFDTAYWQAQRQPDPTLRERVHWLERLTMVRKAFRADARHPGSPLAAALAITASQL